MKIFSDNKFKIGLISAVVISLLAGSLYYININKAESVIINGKEVDKLSKSELKEQKDKILDKHSKLLQEQYRSEVLDSLVSTDSLTFITKDDVKEDMDLTSIIIEEIIIKEDGYNFEITVEHSVNVSSEVPIAFEKEIKEDNSQTTNYKKVETAGVDGKEITTITQLYKNGKLSKTSEPVIEKIDPVTEVTVVGTKKSTASNGSNSSSNSSNKPSSGGNSGGSSGGMLGDYSSYNACNQAGLDKVAANGGNGSFGCLGAEDGSYYFYWWDI